MRLFSSITLTLLICSRSLATGIPVWDSQELINQLADAAYLVSALEGLLNEANGSATGLSMVSKLSGELEAYQRQVRAYEELSGAFEDASNPVFQKSAVLSDQINSVTNHVRKLKRLIAVTGALARPQALTTTLQMLENERQREKEKFAVAFKAIEEQEKIYKLRKELEARVGFKKSLDSELEDIRSFSNGSRIKPVSIKSKKGKRPAPGVGLW